MDVNTSGKTYTFSDIRIHENIKTIKANYDSNVDLSLTTTKETNLIQDLPNITRTSAHTEGNMGYSVNNNVITATAASDNSYAVVYNAALTLEANKSYTFSCNTSGNWGTSGDTVGVKLLLDGKENTSYTMASKVYTFTPTVSGNYWIRFYVNASGKTHTFQDVRIQQNSDSYWTFLGWNTDYKSTSGLSSLKVGENDLTLYSIHKKDVTAFCYYYDGTAQTMRNVTGTAYSGNLNGVVSLDLGTTSLNGYTFVGWFRADEADTRISVSANGIAEISVNTGYWAIYNYTVTATYKYYNGSNYISSTSNATAHMNSSGAKIGTKPTPPTVTNPTGWLGRGWSESTAANASPVTSSANLPAITTNKTYNYSWQKTITLTYNANGGSGAPGSQSGTAYLNYAGTATGASITLSSTKPTKTYYTFQSWNANSSGSGTTYNSGSTYTFSGDITIYAKWTANSYTLTVKPNGGTWNSTTGNGTITQQYGTTKTIANPTPPAGYVVTFNGNGGTSKSSSLTSSKSFTSWTNSGSGSLSGTTYTFGGGNGTLTANYKNNSIALTSATRTGYIFLGWYTAASGGTKVGNAGATYTPTAATTLYAHWQLAVAQIGSTLYPTLASAIAAVPATNVQTGITMLQNTKENVTISSGKNVKLNLNGKTITGASNTSGNNTITNNGTFYLYNGTGAGTVTGGYNVIQNNGTMTFASGTISNGSNFALANSGTLTMSGGTITNSNSHSLTNVSKATISGGTIKLTAPSTVNPSAIYSSSATLSMTGGTVTSSHFGIVSRNNGATANISNVTVSAKVSLVADIAGRMTATKCTINSGNIVNSVGSGVGKMILYNCSWNTSNTTVASDTSQISSGGYGSVVAVFPDSTGYTVYAYGLDTTNNTVYFPTWTAKNAQDDITWGIGTLTTHSNNAAYKYQVKKSDHNNETGTYYTHVYTQGTSIQLESLTYNVN